MQIPIVNSGFGSVRPQGAPVVRVPGVSVPGVNVPGVSIPEGAFDVSSGILDLARTGMSIAGDQMQREKERVSTESTQAVLDYKVASRTAAHQLNQGIQTGQVDPGEAHALFEKQSSTLLKTHIEGLPPSKFSQLAMREGQREQAVNQLSIADAVETSRRQGAAAEAGATLDKLGKLAMLPDSSLESTLSSADNLFPVLATRAGIAPQVVSKTLQDWKDNTRFQRAQSELSGVRHDPIGLADFTKRLENGDLAGTLDPAKRTALVKETDSYRWQLDQLAVHNADRAEKVAERTIGQVGRQIEAGVPLTAKAWLDVSNKVKGTSFAGEFNALVEQETQTQQVLRLPLDQQEAYVQSREAQLMQNGGTMADRANLNRIKSTVETNSKQLETAPLVAASRLYGVEVKALNISDLIAPGGGERAARILGERAITLQSMQKQFGARVQIKPLLPQEAALLSNAIESASPGEAIELYSTLRTVVNDDDVYRAAIQQIAPDSPVKARAGLIAALRVGVTLEHNTLLPDVGSSSRKVAETMLAGDQILNKTKGQGAVDGKSHSLFVPASSAFASQFADAVGDLYRGRPGAQEADLQSALAYYVGKSAKTGKVMSDPKSIDGSLVKESINATMGSVFNFNGVGTVSAPIGMSETDMKQKVREQFAQEIRTRNLPAQMVDQLGSYGLVNYKREGQYVMTLGGLPVIDPATRGPIVLDVLNLSHALGRQRLIDQIPGQAPNRSR